MNFSRRELKNFELAKKASYFSDFPRIKMGCVVVKGNKVLNHAANVTKTHPTQKLLNRHRDYSVGDGKGTDVARLHAETHCLLPFDTEDDLSKAEIYVYRRSGDGVGMAKPCPACTARIKELGIKRVFYTTHNGYAFEKMI